MGSLVHAVVQWLEIRWGHVGYVSLPDENNKEKDEINKEKEKKDNIFLFVVLLCIKFDLFFMNYFNKE